MLTIPTNQKPSKTVKRSVKHVFSDPETRQLNTDLVNALADVDKANNDFDSVKATCKAKIEEAECRVQTVAATLRCGFEMRLKECDVYFVTAQKKKVITLRTDPPGGIGETVATEDMTPEDLQSELTLAESAFDDRKEIVLWPAAGSDSGILVLGNQRGKWYAALRLSVGTQRVEERLDAEQRGFKHRNDAIVNSSARALKWLKDNFKEHADGFVNQIKNVVAAEAEAA